MPSAARRQRQCLTPVSAFLVFCFCLLSSSFAFSQVQVLTEHNDLFRSGANTSETVLTPANVNFSTFGKLFTQSVDGYIVGQPLYLSAVKFPDGSTHNVVYVATQHDSVFAFDGDSDQAPLWNTSFIDPAAGVTTVPISDYGCGGTAFTEIGIVSTPVIDPLTGTLFVLAKTLENGKYTFRLHALNVTTGADVVAPTAISASVSTTSGTLQFNPAIQMQRPALLLANGTIYIGFGSNGCDTYAYNGWLLAYDETSLQQVGAFVTTPNGSKGAIWQAGGGPAADVDGTIFLATGNGTFDANAGGSDYGDSLLHLSAASSGLTVLDYFTPHDQQTLASNDLDLGSGGVILLPDQGAPHTHELLGGGKAGTLYLVDRDNLGGYNSVDDSQIVQSIPQASSGELDSVPAYWNGNVYIAGQSDSIKAFSLSNELLSLQPTSQTSVATVVPGSVSITSDGTNNGILWAIPLNSPARLYAFDPNNLSISFYNTEQAPGERDHLGSVPKFVAPTIANGKVYVGGTSALSVYGLLPRISPTTGNNQSAYVGTTLPVPLQLQTVDAYQGNPIASASVACKDGGAGGSFSAVMPMTTDNQGQAATNYTLPKTSQTITISCTGSGYATGTFSEVGVAGPVSRGTMVSGSNQTGPVFTQLPAALVMQVLDPYSYGVPGVTVAFSDGGAGGTFSSSSVITDSIGEASTFYTTPNNPGTVTVTASTTGITPVKFSEVATATAPGFTLSAAPGTLSVAQGRSVPSTIAVNPINGFMGSVRLAAAGLPSGVTASFNPASTTGTSILTLTASSSATTGPATITITGTSGSLTQTATINLTVTLQTNFTLSSAPGTSSVSQGNSVPSTITVNPTGGFTGSVSLAAVGLPSGVTASFNPASTTGTSILTLTASSSATTGPATVTITGASGSLTQTATINLTVTLQTNFTLSSAPGTLSVSQGNSVPSTIAVNPTGGFTGSVSLAAVGLPSGVTASFNPASTTGTSILTLAASGSATTGPATVSITGTSGSLTQTATINLTVTQPPSYSLSAGTASPTSIRPGGSSTALVTVTSANSYAGSVTLSCSVSPVVSPAPTCSLGGPNPVAVTGAPGSGSATLTFTAIGPSVAMFRHSPSTLYAVWLPAPGLALIGFSLGSGLSRRKRLIGCLLLCILLASIIVLPACGGSGNAGGGGGGNSGTPAGSYSIKITGKDTNNLTQSNAAPTVSVTVN